MAKCQLQVALDGPDTDLKPRSDLVRRLSLDRNAPKDLAGPRRQLGKRALESLDFRTRLDHSGRIRLVIAYTEKRVYL